jgi:hypothetical protein
MKKPMKKRRRRRKRSRRDYREIAELAKSSVYVGGEYTGLCLGHTITDGFGMRMHPILTVTNSTLELISLPRRGKNRCGQRGRRHSAGYNTGTVIM